MTDDSPERRLDELLAGYAADLPEPPDADRLVRAVLTRSALAGLPDESPAPARRHLRYLAALLVAEARLFRVAVPVASALVMALGVVVVTLGTGTGTAAEVLTLIAPIVAAAGVAGAYRSRNEPFAELVDTTPTSPRVLLLVRLTLVLGYDLALALAASAVLAVTAADGDGAAGLDVLVASWLGPMALLSAVSLLAAVRFGPDVALGAAVAVWAVRVSAGTAVLGDGWLARLVLEVWTTSPAVLAASAVAGLLAVAAAGTPGPWGREPGTGRGATHPV
jgi:hypothetical protein